MNKTQAITLLEQQRDAVQGLGAKGDSSTEFKQWRRDTQVAIERIFGQTRNIKDFDDIRYGLIAFTSSTPDHQFRAAYQRGLATAVAVLNSMIDEIETFGFDGEEAVVEIDALAVIERLCLRFHKVARQLQHRHASRATIEIDDEYDMQDLLHGLLRLHFDDVRAEEWTPTYAGGASRVDFLLKAEQIVVEVKKTRASMKAKELGEQLIIDRARYESPRLQGSGVFCLRSGGQDRQSRRHRARSGKSPRADEGARDHRAARGTGGGSPVQIFWLNGCR
ncbi:MAG: hypothetical protein QM608_20740 [Caulobacter sp.]